MTIFSWLCKINCHWSLSLNSELKWLGDDTAGFSTLSLWPSNRVEANSSQTLSLMSWCFHFEYIPANSSWNFCLTVLKKLIDFKLLFSKVYTFTNHQVATIMAYIWLIKLYSQINKSCKHANYISCYLKVVIVSPLGSSPLLFQ